MIKAKDAFNLSMQTWDESDNKNFKDYLESVSKEIEDAANQSKLETTINVTSICFNYNFHYKYHDSLIFLIVKYLEEYGYKTKYYENPIGEWIKISWADLI
jgi:hypothetical protein